MAEILGRATGFNGGRGGTSHISVSNHGFLSTSAIVGGCTAFPNHRRTWVTSRRA
jgi:TPP-dependent pyruvate/acetoin dehydrogenase alpha subunit